MRPFLRPFQRPSLRRFLIPVLAGLGVASSAQAQLQSQSADPQNGNLVEALAACDGTFFKALLADALRWRNETNYLKRDGLAQFFVVNRLPPAPYAISTSETRFEQPVGINGLWLVSFFDADLSKWDHFQRHDIRFMTWGFYADPPPEQTMLWLARQAPDLALRLAKKHPRTPQRVFCTVDAWEAGPAGGRWRAVDEPCDTGLPTAKAPRRVFAVREAPVEHAGSVLACEVWGALTPDIMNALRPDLPGAPR
ncbi:hypothetical protein [Uliginosibacterium sp. H1]|uniref:hypothetical protein n=1 Tax=Uliginosibacterium sp. H1 TaxID=3114757 RepID=UPI002E1868FF|nr:hypothetical protein [Uliginosibacterium sp. H1]